MDIITIQNDQEIQHINLQVETKKQDQVIYFENLIFEIQQKGTNKQILKGISGQIKPGSLTAIMGPTGSGKTSLLNSLACRVESTKNANFTGKVYINGELRNDTEFMKNMAYVMQEDILYAFLTVHETLMYAANFYLAKKKNLAQREEHVEKIINQLGLMKVRDTMVGNARQRGVSGGEKKRVNVGVELISDPQILFLDEPTSGLDSFQALSVCQALKQLTFIGKTIVTSIHQPRSSIVQMFDNLILISEGNMVYNQETQSAMKYFSDQGYPCPQGFNQADHYLDIVSMDYRSQELEIESRERIVKLTKAWKQSELDIMNYNKSQVQDVYQKETKTLEYQSSFFTQFTMLLGRQSKNWMRNKFGIIIKVVTSIIFALLFGAVYSRTVTGDQEIQNKYGILFFIALNQSFSNVIPVLNTFISEKVTVNKERQSKAYSLPAYFLAKVISEIPFNILGPIFFSFIIYFIIGLRSGWVYFAYFFITLIIQVQTAVFIGLVFATIANDVEIGQAIAPPFIIIFVLFSGIFINVDSLPYGSGWVSEISFIKWAFEAFAINEFKDRAYQFTQNGVNMVMYGNKALTQYGFQDHTVEYCWLRIAYVAFVCLALAYILLSFNMKTYMKMKMT